MNNLLSRHIRILTYSVLFVAVPTLLFLAVGNVAFMSRYFTVSFTLVFLFLAFSQKGIVLAAFVFTQFPLINFLKGGFYFYNISTFLLLLTYIILYIKNYRSIQQLFSNRKYLYIFIFFLSYYLLSFLFTGRYNANLRAVDFILSAGLIPIIFPFRKIFKSMFFYMGIISVIFALIIGYYGGRYLDPDLISDTEIGGGNPSAYGIPVALFLTMLFFAPNYVIPFNLNKKNNWFLWVLIIVSAVALIVTTSRGAILSFTMCFVVVLILKRSVFTKLKYFIIVGLVLIAYNVASTYFPQFRYAEEFIVGRAQADNMDVNKYSHNRVLMWEMVKNELENGNYIFTAAGPGKQVDEFGLIATRQSKSGNFNMNYAFHALPLQLTIELGLIITLVFYITLIFLILGAIRKFNSTDFILPLLGIVFWVGITMSITGLDHLSGMAMGFFFLNLYSSRSQLLIKYINSLKAINSKK